MSFALRACLFASAAAGLAACASDPTRGGVEIDYRAANPDGPAVRRAPQPVMLADVARPVAPPVVAPVEPVRPPEVEPAPYQLVADLGPSSGMPAVAEARGMAPESGGRPGGARRVAADIPASRAVEVQPRDTLYDISRRYNVNMRALIETNALEPPYALNVGDTIFLPPPNVHRVEKGETLYSVSRRYNVDTRSLALLNNMARPWTVWPGDELLLPPLARDQARDSTIPASAAPVLAPPPPLPIAPPPQVAVAPAPKAPSLKPPEPKGPVSLTPSGNPPASLASGGAAPAAKPEPKPPAATPVAPPAPKPQQTPKPVAGSGEFIWPVSGEVLKGFGPAANGQRNDGVNISAPKGSEVRAAAGGEVVYAGSELAGFGNLVLIRHPGGWVTAYAHADTITVKEGELVKQGQVVATVGSTGNAASPQVHFELRKGKEPVDPAGHLPPLRG